MDATRAWDGKQVMFKKIPAGPGLELPDEPEQKLIVMPFLRPFDNPRFQTYGEFVSFFSQICDVRLGVIVRLET